MVGGTVAEVIVCEDSVWVDCQDTVHPKDPTCAVYVVRNEHSEQIKPGDKFWWQGGSAFWTTPDYGRVDFELEKISGSGVGRPAGY